MVTSVLIIGSGGREHALAWKLSQSPQVDQVYVAPGNGGTHWQRKGYCAPSENVAIAVTDYDALLTFTHRQEITLTVVGPEVPLTDGIVDRFQAAGRAIFGPVQAAARIEASKAFAKDFMQTHGIPTGTYLATDDPQAALQFVRDCPQPVVVKASGLAAGKGVIICDNQADAHAAIHQIMTDKAFGQAGNTIVIEERLYGRELSVLAFCDGKIATPMMVARDHKRALDGDTGLNTGGMGAIAPTNDVSQAMMNTITQMTLQPVVDGMAERGTPYTGILYAGLMLTEQGIQVLEYNCRFGDPETQVVLPMLKNDLYAVMQACLNETLDTITLEWHDGYCSTVVCASGGYPESYSKGKVITGLDHVDNQCMVFHAGTRHEGDSIVTNGGRVLAVSAQGTTLDAALARSYAGVDAIHFDGKHFRTDIGKSYE